MAVLTDEERTALALLLFVLDKHDIRSTTIERAGRPAVIVDLSAPKRVLDRLLERARGLEDA